MNRRWLAAEPFTLVLSAGFFGFFAHTGVLAALEAFGLRPHRVVGVSAGALAGGLWASGIGAAQLEERLRDLRRDDFWDPGLPAGGLLRGGKFRALLLDILRDTGVEHVDRTPTPFAAVAYDVMRRRTVVLEDGPIASAIVASCAVPFMFRPVPRRRRLLVDGGVRDRAGETAVDPGERVFLHYLPSSSTHRGVAVPRGQPPSLSQSQRSLTIPGLPRVGPFELYRGPWAFERARRVTMEWLEGDGRER